MAVKEIIKNSIFEIIENTEVQGKDYVNPSIGEIGRPYYDKENDRIKFFSTEVFESFEKIEQAVSEAYRLMQDHNATRINLRFLSKLDYLFNVEAKISLNKGFSGINLYFIGINDYSRLSSEEILVQEDNIISRVKNKPLDLEGHVDLPEKFELSNLKDYCFNDIMQLERLYNEAFKTYTAELNSITIKEMLENSVVYGIRYKGAVVSTVVAEIANIKLNDGRDFRISELSEMATFREFRGKGLVSYATRALLKDISDKVDLIYAEDRASHLPINRAFYKLGFDYAGRLNKQCILSGDRDVEEQGPYENLNVWYMLPG